MDDAGLYTCLASSLAGEDGKNHWVRVQGDTSCSCSSWKIYLIPPLSYFLSAPGPWWIKLCVNSGVKICLCTKAKTGLFWYRYFDATVLAQLLHIVCNVMHTVLQIYTGSICLALFRIKCFYKSKYFCSLLKGQGYPQNSSTCTKII